MLPLGERPGQKASPPRHYTGHGAADPSGADVEAWIETHGAMNIGLRAPEGVIGLDVDAYEKDGKLKTGAAELERLVAEYGPLPDTWVSGARKAPSGIYWFRVPIGPNWPGEAGKGIEIVQHGHRYAVVWPSTNPDADGAEYVWRHGLAPHLISVDVPHPETLPELPDAWVQGLSLAYARTERTPVAFAPWWDALRSGPACPRVASALTGARAELLDGARGRHEVARDSARVLAAYGGEGHAGAAEALLALGADFAQAVGKGREGEWLRLLTGAVELAATDNPVPRQLCACAPPALPTLRVPNLPTDDAGHQVVPRPKADEPIEAETLTDAQLVAKVHDELLCGRFVWSRGIGWFAWEGQRWHERPEETVVEAVRLWAVAFVEQQVSNPYIGAVRETRQLLIGLLSKYRLTAIVALARGLCAVEQDAFDAHPDLLNTPTGVVDLRTGEQGPHDPLLLLTKITSTDYVPGATHEDWPAALRAVRPDVADWLQVRFGQSVTGHMTPDDLMLILRGGGENGKSTILNAVKAAIGDFGVYISDRVLLSDPGSHPTELMDFKGTRFALTEELPDEARLNVKRLKDVVGTPTMKARRMRQDPIEFAATHSFFISTNPIPIVAETDHGTWRRLALVTFPYRFTKPGANADESRGELPGDATLRDRVKDGQRQREAVLAWLVAGARRWYAAGKVMPPLPASVVDDTQQWRAKSDPIEGFWAERLRPAEDHFITSSDLTAAFNEYLLSIGQKEWSDRKFVPAFGDHTTTKNHRVEYAQRRVSENDVRSYRTANVTVPSPWVPAPTAVGAKVRAWWGVRFASHTEVEQGE